MDISQLLSAIGTAVKFPVFIVFKSLIAILNLIPTRIYELHGARGNSGTNRPDLRELGSAIRGKKRLGVGSAIIAWQRGVVFTASQNPDPKVPKVCGVWTEDFEAIQKKWTF